MSETDSFVEEVSDELRRDRLFAMFRRYGPYVIALLVLLVLGSAWNEWRKAGAESAREVAGDALLAALGLPDDAARAEAVGALRAAGPADGTMLRLAEAGALVRAGRRPEAEALYLALSGDAALGPLYRGAATILYVGLRGAAMPPDEREAMLAPLSGPDAPYRLLALEQRALARIDAAEPAKAAGHLIVILSDQMATEGLRERALALLQALGPAAMQTEP